MIRSSEITQLLLDQAASGRLSRRRFLVSLSAAGLSAGLSEVMMEHGACRW